MRVFTVARLAAAAILLATIPAWAGTPGNEVVSTMRNVNAVGEANGFRLSPAYDAAADAGPNDLAAPQAFEVIRPDGKAFSLGRLYTSCACIQLEAPQRNYGAGERAVLQLRNITPTPINGQVYAVYVQITSPIRATLRYDTFVQTRTFTSADSDADATPETGTSAAASEAIEVIIPDSLKDEAVVTADQLEPATTEVADASDAEKGEESKSAFETARQEMEAFFEDVDAPAGTDVAAAPPAGSLRPPSASETASAPEALGEPEPLPPPEELQAEPPAPAVAAIPESPAAAPPAVSAAPAVPEPPAAPETAVIPPQPEPSTPPASVVATPAGSALAKPLETISLITIGVRDMSRSIKFYEELGWRRASRNKYDQTAFFQLNGQVLALYPLGELLKEQNMDDAKPSPGGITLALHVPNKADVKTTYDSFIAAGGKSLKPPTEMPSGAVTSYVADPDGNPWEISWVPQFRVDSEGKLWLP